MVDADRTTPDRGVVRSSCVSTAREFSSSARSGPPHLINEGTPSCGTHQCAWPRRPSTAAARRRAVFSTGDRTRRDPFAAATMGNGHRQSRCRLASWSRSDSPQVTRAAAAIGSRRLPARKLSQHGRANGPGEFETARARGAHWHFSRADANHRAEQVPRAAAARVSAPRKEGNRN
ncbi:hypothetical protein MRX96_013328 [Rhipicephalus microplus]